MSITKKYFAVIFTLMLLVCSFSACTAKNTADDLTTTAVTDDEGNTVYYEVATDERGNALTNDEGSTYLTEVVSSKTNENNPSQSSNSNNADNDVQFITPQNSDNSQNENTEITTSDVLSEKETTIKDSQEITTQSVTDKDGWINKWY